MFDFLLTATASILFVADPLGALPAYIVLTAKYDAAKRRETARRASVIATGTLAAFALAGPFTFRLLGLTLPAFQAAGGLILFLVALDMIRADRSTQERPEEVDEGMSADDVAVTPLAVPILAGPATMSAAVTLVSRAQTPFDVLSVYLAIAITGLAAYLTLRLAEPIQRRLGRTGIHIFSRVMGLVLAAIAVQFVLDGLRAAGVVPAQPAA